MTSLLHICLGLLEKVGNIQQFMLYIRTYTNTETVSYYIRYEGLLCKNSFSRLFMHTRVLTSLAAMQENTAMESEQTVLTDINLLSDGH
jgi:hypothetical protein